MAKVKIRTKKRPFEVIEVEGPEYVDLVRQGLVHKVESDLAKRPTPRKNERPEAPATGDPAAPAVEVENDKEK